MKYTTLVFHLAVLSLTLTGCFSESKKSSSSSSSSSAYCAQYPYAAGCTTTNPCIANPYALGCQGNTTGSTTGGTNPYTQIPSTPVSANWGVKYPGGVPQGSCSTPYAPMGLPNPYDTRKATMTIVGGSWYNPASSQASGYLNTSSLLKSVSGAQTLFSSDSLLKVRFKPLPQPESANSSTVCAGRVFGNSIAGYTKLMYSVRLIGRRADGTRGEEPVGTFTTGVNACSEGIDLSSFAAMYPGGIHLIVENVMGNQAYYPSDYQYKGFEAVNSFVIVRPQECWALDVEVAADGTKTFD